MTADDSRTLYVEIINSYLNGQESFAVAARKLARLIRDELDKQPPVPPPLRTPDGKPLTLTPGVSAFIRSQTPETRAKSSIPSSEPNPHQGEDERAERLVSEAHRLAVLDVL